MVIKNYILQEDLSMGENVKKPLWKKWWFWVIIVIVIGAIANAGEKEEAKPTTATPEQQQAQPQPQAQTSETPQAQPEQKKEEPQNKPTISKAEFDQIQNGMTYEEVVKIIGGEGELLSETGTKGDPAHTVMYKWDGEGDIGANANAMFQGGKMINKSQFGLK
jgi:hypothetical protein